MLTVNKPKDPICYKSHIRQSINRVNRTYKLSGMTHVTPIRTVYPNKYAHGFVVLCFVVVMQSFIKNSHEVFIHIHQGCFAGTGAIVRLPQCQWSKPDGYGKISQCITTTKHSKAVTVCIFLGIYCKYGKHSSGPSTYRQWVHTYKKLFSCKSVLTICSYRIQSNETCTYRRVSSGCLLRVRRYSLL